ncbi:MAG: hypothetical protein WC854_01825 [Bacteroidales bacterium]
MIFNYTCTFIRRHKRNAIFIFLLLFASVSIISGQKSREEPPPFRDRLFFGGNFGLQFGTITNIQVSPVVGLWILPRLAVAVGPDYRFYKYRNDRTNIYGGKGYLQFVIIKDINSVIPVGVNMGIFLHVEDELLSLESSKWPPAPLTSDRFYINTVLAGGGISQQIGRRSSLNIMVLWALNDSEYDVYSNPEIRVSFNF